MPELPDIELYIACLRPRVVGHSFSEFKTYNPFALRTVTPKPADLIGTPITDLWRIGKRVAFGFEGGATMVIHLMLAGRFRWTAPVAAIQRKVTHASWRFAEGSLLLTEASSKKRAGIWLFPDRESAQSLDPGGVEPLACTLEEFAQAIAEGNHTLERALTNPFQIAGIGNTFSDEILHAAKLSPFKLGSSLSPAEMEALYRATVETLTQWRDRLITEFDGGKEFPGPGQVTAFRPDYAAHGKFKEPCPVCGKPIQRVVYAEREFNYCAGCQTGGRILADRSLSRLLKDDWPRTFADEE